MSYSEIGNVLDIDKSSVYARIKNAKFYLLWYSYLAIFLLIL